MRPINKLRYCLVAAIPVVALAACSSGGSSASRPGRRRRADHHDRRGADSGRGGHLHRPGRRLLRAAGADRHDQADQRRRVRHGRPADRQGAAHRGQLRLVHPRPDRGHVRGAQPEEPRAQPSRPSPSTCGSSPTRRRCRRATRRSTCCRARRTRPCRTWSGITWRSASTRCTTSARCCSARCSPRTVTR